jgi:ElaB/YqjD/DUF883 family membrane-anchored ribosome-binding protein
MGERSDAMNHGDDMRARSADEEIVGRAREDTVRDAPEDTARIRSEIARTREDMSETIDAIQERLSPRNLASQAKESVKEATVGRVKQAARTVSDSASNIAETTKDTAVDVAESVRHNPWPALLIGAGAAWWVIDRSRQSGYDRRTTVIDYEHDDGTSGIYEARGVDATAAYGYGYGETYDTRYANRRTGWNGASQFKRLLQQNPLAVGAVAATLGIAVGLAIPETERENRLMGETRDTLADRAKDAAQGAVEKAKQVAGDAASQVAGEAARQVTGASKER